MTAIEPPTSTKPKNTQGVGLALLFLAMAVGSLSRSMHLPQAASIAGSTLSGCLSLAAIGLFYKNAAPGRARHVMLGTAVAILAAGVLAAFVLLRH